MGTHAGYTQKKNINVSSWIRMGYMSFIRSPSAPPNTGNLLIYQQVFFVLGAKTVKNPFLHKPVTQSVLKKDDKYG